MNTKKHALIILIVSCFSLILMMNIAPYNGPLVRANARHVRIIRHERSHRRNVKILKGRQRQHRANQKRYRHYQHVHKANRKRIRQRRHQHNRRVKKINRIIVRNRNYGFYHNYRHDVHTLKPRDSYHEVKGNERVTFSHPIFLNYIKYTGRRHNRGHHNGDPQSMAILPNGHAYVLFNVDHHDSPIDQIIEYNIRNGRKIKVGHTFHGGHGQGLSYNYRTHQLWACMNRYATHGYPRGIISKRLLLAQINQRSLRPMGHWNKIHTKLMLGENIAYDKYGNYWNVARNYSKEKHDPLASLQVYQGHNHRIRMVKDILHSPGACIQNLTYNPDTNRLYVIGNGVIMSFPISRINHLKNRDVKVAVMNRHSEFEGMGFWNHRAYLLVHPDRILRSNRPF